MAYTFTIFHMGSKGLRGEEKGVGAYRAPLLSPPAPPRSSPRRKEGRSCKRKRAWVRT
jgi:hypothetical protein